MFVGLFLALAAVRCEEDDVYNIPELPFEGDYAQPEEIDPFDENSVEQNEAEAAAEPTPTPVPEHHSLQEIVGLPEIIVVVTAVIYLIVFISGRSTVKAKISKVCDTLLESFRRYFAVVPQKFEQRNYHTYDTWITGRTGYQGALITQKFKKACDPIGIVLDLIRSGTDKLQVEVLLKPRHSPSMMYHVGKDKPHFADDMKLKSHAMGQRLTSWTDLPVEIKSKITEMVSKFMEQNPGVLELLELSNVNRFDTNKDNKFVAHFEFKVYGKIEDFMNDEIVDFIMALCDEFVMMKLPADVQARNEKIRELMIKSQEPKEEKKLTPEEEEKARKRRERREEMRFKPRMKVVRQ